MATFLAIEDFNKVDSAIIAYVLFKNHTKIQLFGINYNLFVIIYNEFKVSLTIVESSTAKVFFYFTYVGIKPRNPMSTTFSPIAGSYLPSALTSCHSKLLLIESERVTTTLLVS